MTITNILSYSLPGETTAKAGPIQGILRLPEESRCRNSYTK